LAASSLGEELTGPVQKGRGGGPGGWWILDEPELHLGADILVPDLAGWRRSRMPTLPETAFFALAPDWACWVLSPSTAQMDRVDKLPIYASHGVNHAWLVDPEAKTLEILSLHEGHWRLEIAFKRKRTKSVPSPSRQAVSALPPCGPDAAMSTNECREESGALPTRAPRKADCHNQPVVVQCDTLCAPGVGDAATICTMT
jgi:hypothetical protein